MMTSEDRKLANRLSVVAKKAQMYGTKSKRLERYIKKYRDDNEFSELAGVAIDLMRKEGVPDKVEQAIHGVKPIPLTLSEFFSWATSGYRIRVALLNLASLYLTVSMTINVNPVIGFTSGAAFLWISERIREVH